MVPAAREVSGGRRPLSAGTLREGAGHLLGREEKRGGRPARRRPEATSGVVGKLDGARSPPPAGELLSEAPSGGERG